MRQMSRQITVHGFTLAALAVGGLLAGCGAGAATAAKATSTCPAAPPIATVTGKITATSSGSIMVTTSGGTTKQVQVPSTARISDIVTVAPASLTKGTPVLVVTDTAATTAQRIQVLSGTGTGISTGGFGGRPGARGTPPTGANTSCFRRQGQGSGTGQGFGSGGRGPGGFAGLRGTVDSATATNLTFDDTTGQTYSVAITATTVISKTAPGQLSDLRQGASVMVIGATSGGNLVARSITVQASAA